MEPDRTGKDAPRLTFSLELQVDSLLQTVITLGGPLHESVHQAMVQGLHELMETLGIPGEPEVAITVLERPLPDGRFRESQWRISFCATPMRLCGRFIAG